MRPVVLVCAVCALLVRTVSARGRAPTTVSGVPEALFVKDDWIFSRSFLYKRDQALSGEGPVKVRPNRMVKFPSGEVGFWKVESKRVEGSRKGKTNSKFVIDVPQDEEQEILMTYEIPVTSGRYHKSAVRFAGKGEIFIRNSKAVSGSKGTPSARKKIGSFKVDLETLEPMVDHAFR